MLRTKKRPPMKQYKYDNGEVVMCPRCGYDCVRVVGAATTGPGIDPLNIELECGRCEMPFYIFIRGK